MPIVSVIVTTYNRKEYLTETIQSILNQTYQDFELIVVDNYSNYDFFSHINSFNDSRIKPYQNRNNGIIAINRNFGISKANGDFLAFCDDDDIWMNEKLESQMNYIKAKQLEGAKIVLYSNAIEFKENSEANETKKTAIKDINDLLKTNQVSFSTSFVSNNFASIRFNELPEFFAVEDYVFWMELKLSGFSFHLQRQSLIKYRVLSSSSSSSVNYGLNHLKNIIVIVYIALKNKDAKINYFILGFSTILEVLKFVLKKTRFIHNAHKL